LILCSFCEMASRSSVVASMQGNNLPAEPTVEDAGGDQGQPSLET
jgi:hypothetical protein